MGAGTELRVGSDPVGPVAKLAHRTDIEGLRAVAVILVVLFHAGVPYLGGGFVGVDVFLVLSGYLITRSLRHELETTGRIDPVGFWARRFRRLLPALALMVFGVLVAGALIRSPLGWGSLAREAVSAATYTSNIMFAVREGGYFGGPESPFLHTWSLSVEEQFYLGWPVLLVGTLFVVRAWSRRVGRASLESGRGSQAALPRATTVALSMVVVAVTIMSFLLSLWLTDRGTPWAYLASPSRAWEFGAGAAIVFLPRRFGRSAAAHGAVGALGLVMIVASAGLYSDLTPFPGFAALLPVIGTMAVIVAGEHAIAKGPVDKYLALGPLQWLGAISYSWYLWHWPVIILGQEWLGELDLPGRLALALFSLVPAGLSYRFVENPLRRSIPVRRPSLVLAGGVVASIGLVAGALGLAQLGDRILQDDPYLAELAEARAGRAETGLLSCPTVPVSADAEQCRLGPDEPAATVLLVGDSYAGQWSPTVAAAAESLEAETVIRTYGGCPAPDLPVAIDDVGSVSATCGRFRSETQRLIDEVQPKVVVFSNSDYTDRLVGPGGAVLDANEGFDIWLTEASDFAGELADSGIRVVFVSGYPRVDHDPIECLARYREPDACELPSATALARNKAMVESLRQQIVATDNIEIVDVTGLVCPADECRLLANDGPVFSDDSHLSFQFMEANSAPIVDAVRRALNDDR